MSNFAFGPIVGPTVVSLPAHFDGDGVSEMRSVLEMLVQGGRDDVILDMSAVREIDSAGIGAIVFLFKRLIAQERRLSLASLGEDVGGLLSALPIDRTIPIIPPIADERRLSVTPSRAVA